MLRSFSKLATKIITESMAELSPAQIADNFRSTGEYARLSESISSEEKKQEFDAKIDQIIEKMCQELTAKATPFNTEKISFWQYIDPTKVHGYDGGYLIPSKVWSSDKLEVITPMTSKKDMGSETSRRIIVLGDYLTRDASVEVNEAFALAFAAGRGEQQRPSWMKTR